MAMHIDLNADLGEMGAESPDDALLALVSSCNIACGGHAGDDGSMRQVVRMAVKHGVAMGAHPSLPDRIGFGRRDIALDATTLRASLHAQVGDLIAICASEGATLTHVKPHGALYHQMARDDAIAQMIATVILELDSRLALIGPTWGDWAKVAKDHGLRTRIEGFADRRYRDDGTLVSRSEPDALLHGGAAIEQGVRLARGGPPRIDTLCVHGDGSDAVALTQELRAVLIANGIEIRRC